MYVLVAISLFSMLLAYLEYKKKCNNGLALGFILLTIIMGLRFEYGNVHEWAFAKGNEKWH